MPLFFTIMDLNPRNHIRLTVRKLQMGTILSFGWNGNCWLNWLLLNKWNCWVINRVYSVYIIYWGKSWVTVSQCVCWRTVLCGYDALSGKEVYLGNDLFALNKSPVLYICIFTLDLGHTVDFTLYWRKGLCMTFSFIRCVIRRWAGTMPGAFWLSQFLPRQIWFPTVMGMELYLSSSCRYRELIILLPSGEEAFFYLYNVSVVGGIYTF